MSTDQDSKSANTPSGAAELGSEFQSVLSSMDTLAGQRLKTLQLVQQGRLSQLSRALAEAKAHYPVDSQEVKTAEAAVAATTATSGRVSMAHQQLTTPDPDVDKGGWAFHGRVFDPQLKPVSGFTVFLVDSQKKYQQEFGFSYTDDTGYFLINYQAPQTPSKGQPDPSTPPRTRPSAGTAPKAAAEPDSPSTSAPQLFLEIANTRAQPVFLAEAPFQPVTGSATYENIILPSGNQPLGDPPKEIRTVAIPRAGKRPAPPAGPK